MGLDRKCFAGGQASAVWVATEFQRVGAGMEKTAWPQLWCLVLRG